MNKEHATDVVYLSITILILLLIILKYCELKKLIIVLPERKAEPFDGNYDEYFRQIAYKDKEFGSNPTIRSCCVYALTGGKHMRGKLCELIAVGGYTYVDELALAIEYLHSASLIVDDLPAFDNDSFRRGRLSTHKAYGESTAQMCATILVANAMKCVCRHVDNLKRNGHIYPIDPDAMGSIILSHLSEALGTDGASEGQVMDMLTPEMMDKQYGSNKLDELLYKKTGAFFKLTVVMGWIGSGKDEKLMKYVYMLGTHIGIMFQIADDIGDMESDKEKNKWNYANTYGKQYAIDEITMRMLCVKKLLKVLKLNEEGWDELVMNNVDKMILNNE